MELIFFTHEVSYYPPGFPEYEKRVSHPWASKQPGWIDYAFLGSGDSSADISKIINERSATEGSGVSYQPTVSGGRLNPDGRKLEWVLNIAEIAKHGKGVLPFFCGDVSPREWRVRTYVRPADNLLLTKGFGCIGSARAGLECGAREYCEGRRTHQASGSPKGARCAREETHGSRRGNAEGNHANSRHLGPGGAALPAE